jgi:hypothetical protein
MSYIKSRNSKKRGEFVPRFPEKYKGRYPIVYRSEWERMYCQWCDSNQKVVSWSSESIYIPYYDPVKQKTRRYYPDFTIKYKTSRNKFVKFLIEVKPYKETIAPKSTKRKSEKTRMYEQTTYLTNKAKWKAAEDYCKKFGYVWKILTEKELFRKRR